jgi:hypothetical protein
VPKAIYRKKLSCGVQITVYPAAAMNGLWIKAQDPVKWASAGEEFECNDYTIVMFMEKREATIEGLREVLDFIELYWKRCELSVDSIAATVE